jgi:FtsH-binding integral membrane protein
VDSAPFIGKACTRTPLARPVIPASDAYATPEEDKKQIDKDFWIYLGIFVLTALGLVLAAAVGYLVPANSGIPNSGTQASAYMVRIFQFVMIMIALGLAGWLSARTRKRLLQKKLRGTCFWRLRTNILAS